VPDGDDLVHLVAIGTIPPTAHEALRAFLAALARRKTREPSLARRLRVHFFGTSNQRADHAPLAVLPLVHEFGLERVVSEAPARLDYFDVLNALDQATAVLLLGSNEPHYTPSRVFTAMMSGRPLLGLYHRESTATELLRRFGGPPAVQLVTYDAVRGVGDCVDDITEALRAIAAHPSYDPATVDLGVLASSSAPALAQRLASIFDRIARA
jgi:hypothetical protein